MISLQKSQNPYTNETQPQRYFGELIEILKSDRVIKDIRDMDLDCKKDTKAA